MKIKINKNIFPIILLVFAILSCKESDSEKLAKSIIFDSLSFQSVSVNGEVLFISTSNLQKIFISLKQLVPILFLKEITIKNQWKLTNQIGNQHSKLHIDII